MIMVIVITLFLFSIIIHEIAHAVAARELGDDTAWQLGRITLDPLKHIDPMMTVVVPLVTYFGFGVIFGGAKPVPVNPLRFRRPRKGMMWVALAGPVSNVLLAVVFTVGAGICYAIDPSPQTGSFNFIAHIGLREVARVNVLLACFNLIPVLPLDGGRVLVGLLPEDLARSYSRIEHFGMIIILALVLTRSTHFVFEISDAIWKAGTLGVFGLFDTVLGR